jgi:two-component system LytT family response regulator
MIAPQSEGIRVLVVDDEASARLRLIDLLRQDVQVRAVMAASDGEMAVRMILSERPDLVLLDVQMPELNGMEVVDKIGGGAHAAHGFCDGIRSARNSGL